MMDKIKRVLCFGDSITYGYNPYFYLEGNPLRLPYDDIWTTVAQKELGSDYLLINEGMPGRTSAVTDPVNPYLNGRSALKTTVMTHYPFDIVVLMLGTNDVQPIYNINAPVAVLIIETLLKEFKNPNLYFDGKQPKILLCSPLICGADLSSSPFSGMFAGNCREKLIEMVDGYEAVAKRNAVKFFDINSVAHSCESGDKLHPDAENQHKLGVAIAQLLKKM